MNTTAFFRQRLAEPGIIVAPGAYDAVSARLVAKAGFEAVYVGSYATAASALGMPDAGLLSRTEMVDHAAAIVNAVPDVPVIADAEDGFGNATTIWRTVRDFQAAGVVAIHLEDHTFGKHLPVPGKVAPTAEMVEKISAAAEARTDADFVIIGRTDAGWLEGAGGLTEAVDRANAYAAAGADMVFLAGIPSYQLAAVVDDLARPLVNTEALGPPRTSVAQDAEAGVKLLIHFSMTLFAAYRAVGQALADFHRSGDHDAVHKEYLVDEAEFDEFIGFPAIQELAHRHRLTG